MEDEAIIALYFQRDEAAVRETRTRYGERLRRLARDILYDRRDAEETENDTYLQAWNSIPPQRPRYFYAYLARLCRNLALNRLDWAWAQRRNAPLVSLTEEMEQCVPDRLTENPADSEEIGRVISDFLEAQTRENRVIFVRRYFLAEPVRDIALRLDCSESRVKSSLFRTRRALRVWLEKEEIDI